ncbi:hypothetical protein BU16DRAFT_513059 [Lophium mytilinum]|uniref:Flavin-nucleotide-binding protein n=1 Tax=Lophium mytilinum TaxID=390894 RepID=A0A6A6QMP2_9PEZI|nr:hypothetical protein BU16DRAFT_513059 [Lophium mytilinum]
MQPATLRRHTERAKYDIDSVSAVFDQSFFAHIAFVDRDGLPQCIPMIALLRNIDEDTESTDAAVYLHGHPQSALMQLVKKSDDEKSEPIKVSVTATKVDGLALSSAPNGHTFNYRSATVHGPCHRVLSRPAKLRIMHDVTNHIVPNRYEMLNPIASLQVSLVFVIRVEIDTLSFKFREGPPGIQPRNAKKDGPGREGGVWTGVVPLWEQLGEPVESGLTPGVAVPEGLRGFVEGRSRGQRDFAVGVASRNDSKV